ncbi:CDP-6-deoxy-L-threo-D-glycero-4-hexulose-3-dehydrase reductase [Pigmentiphaga litoralis]|uniref:2Fe-2S iron-sulfur cluster-binding protein n=1 Tax=Pigmentiphaga litoralis TaxID=516702 RepID=UPI0016795A81|nr:2Fe-2S iron-sulfur cluster-binding protein [Pigmentiphaga litoralis]GGX22654.1 CDP-6-deoxy-L-threo-D-glycero-4-hexulose-3-dehydrase reductase [Pigmentiphaga litoralis]
MQVSTTSSVTIQPSGRQFNAAPGQTLLQAALDAGVNLPYNCRAGHCGVCRGRVTAGAIRVDAFTPGVNDQQRAEGHVLLCRTHAAADLVVIEIQETGSALAPPRTIACQITSVEQLSETVAVVKLRLPMHGNAFFLRGEGIDVLFDDGQTRSYSMAQPPRPHGMVAFELHLQHRPGARFADSEFHAELTGKTLRIHAPPGTYFLREASAKPLVLLAGGTGFASIKAALRYLQETGVKRSATLYWQGHAPSDFRMREIVEQWAAEHSNFHFVPVLSGQASSLDLQAWAGRTGSIHDVAQQDLIDLSGHQVYACGSPAMVSAARRTFIEECGLGAGDFFSKTIVPTPRILRAISALTTLFAHPSAP